MKLVIMTHSSSLVFHPFFHLRVQKAVDLSLYLAFLNVVARVQSPQMDSCKIIFGVLSLGLFNRRATAARLWADPVEQLLRFQAQINEILGSEATTASVGLHVYKVQRGHCRVEIRGVGRRYC